MNLGDNGGRNNVDRNQDDCAELRATLQAMMKISKRFPLAWVMMSLLDRGQISKIRHPAQPTRYKIARVGSLADVEDLIATVENPVQAAVLELSVSGRLTFACENANLRFFSVKRVV